MPTCFPAPGEPARRQSLDWLPRQPTAWMKSYSQTARAISARACLAVNDGRFLDLIEIDAASNTGVDDIRSLRDKINFAPKRRSISKSTSSTKYICFRPPPLMRCSRRLEEPPSHAIFISGNHRRAQGTADNQVALPTLQFSPVHHPRNRRPVGLDVRTGSNW